MAEAQYRPWSAYGCDATKVLSFHVLYHCVYIVTDTSIGYIDTDFQQCKIVATSCGNATYNFTRDVFGIYNFTCYDTAKQMYAMIHVNFNGHSERHPTNTMRQVDGPLIGCLLNEQSQFILHPRGVRIYARGRIWDFNRSKPVRSIPFMPIAVVDSTDYVLKTRMYSNAIYIPATRTIYYTKYESPPIVHHSITIRPEYELLGFGFEEEDNLWILMTCLDDGMLYHNVSHMSNIYSIWRYFDKYNLRASTPGFKICAYEQYIVYSSDERPGLMFIDYSTGTHCEDP